MVCLRSRWWVAEPQMNSILLPCCASMKVILGTRELSVLMMLLVERAHYELMIK